MIGEGAVKRLLVTGASGFLGWNICTFPHGGWEMFGTVFSHQVEIPNVTAIRVDLTNFEDSKRLFEDVSPDAVINTAAASNPDFCQVNGTASRKINVDVAVNLAGICGDRGIPYLYTSSDLVFDGLKAPYSETDRVGPVNVYGEQKVAAEQGILGTYPEAVICRMPLMFGASGLATINFFQNMLNAMQKREALRLFMDEFRTPVSGKTAASGIFLALHKIRGLIHLGGIERISRYEFGALMAKIFGFEKATLISCQQRDIETAAPRPVDVSLDSTKAFALGYKPSPVAEELQQVCQELQLKR